MRNHSYFYVQNVSIFYLENKHQIKKTVHVFFFDGEGGGCVMWSIECFDWLSLFLFLRFLNVDIF